MKLTIWTESCLLTKRPIFAGRIMRSALESVRLICLIHQFVYEKIVRHIFWHASFCRDHFSRALSEPAYFGCSGHHPSGPAGRSQSANQKTGGKNFSGKISVKN